MNNNKPAGASAVPPRAGGAAPRVAGKLAAGASAAEKAALFSGTAQRIYQVDLA